MCHRSSEDHRTWTFRSRSRIVAAFGVLLELRAEYGVHVDRLTEISDAPPQNRACWRRRSRKSITSSTTGRTELTHRFVGFVTSSKHSQGTCSSDKPSPNVRSAWPHRVDVRGAQHSGS